MNSFIREYSPVTISTYEVDTLSECEQIINLNKKNNFTLYHNNIRSLTKNLDEMKVYLSQISTEFDCFVFTETWQLQDISLFRLENYNMIYNEGHFNQNDGVVIYLKSGINYESKIIRIGDIKVINVLIYFNNQNLSITAIYRSPSSSPYQFNQDLRNYLNENNTHIHNYKIIVGDINIDILSDLDYSQEYLNIFSEAGYNSVINNYTRVTHSSKSCIDHIFVRSAQDLDLYEGIILKSNITDHFATLLNLELEKINTVETKEANFITKINFEKLKILADKENWDELSKGINDMDVIVDTLIDKLQYIIKGATYKIKVAKKRKQWITSGLIKSTNRKNYLYKKSCNDPNNIQLKQEYNDYKNKLSTLIKVTKINYFKQQLQKANSSKNIWLTINNMTGHQNKNRTEIKKIKNEDDEVITSKKDISEEFVKYFTNVGKKLADKIPKSKNTFCTGKREVNSVFFSPTTAEEVKMNIANLKNHTSPGIDGISSDVLKALRDNIAAILAEIINKSIDLGYFPAAFKASIIKPIFKTGDKEKVNNYRPISLLSNLAKVYEKIIKIRMSEYIKKYDLLSEKQFGFRENKSTQDAIAYLTDMIYSSLNKHKKSACVFLDLAKAFDTVSHPQLLQNLEQIGVRGKTYGLMESYLTGRKQTVQIDDIKSEPRLVEYGVPQGTVLGPLLFTIYINNLFEIQSTGHVVSFADDTAIFYEEDDWADLKIKIEKDFSKIKSWFDNKLLTINFDKTKFIPFACYKNSLPNYNNLNIKYDNNKEFNIESTDHIKYLGIYIDCHMRWDVHINYLIKKIRGIIYKFKQIKQILEFNQLKIIYYALIESQLQYGIIGWGGVMNIHLNNLNIIQKRILKIMLNRSPQYPSKLVYAEAKVLDIKFIYCKTLLNYYYKNKNKYNVICHQYSTRLRNIIGLVLPTAVKTLTQKCFTYIIPRLCNILPIKIKQLNNIYKYKREIQKWLLNENVQKNIYEILNN